MKIVIPDDYQDIVDRLACFSLLAGHHVVEAIAAGYEARPDESFERRLLRAIEAGRDAGGQVGNDGHLTERSAGVFVYGAYDHAELLRLRQR